MKRLLSLVLIFISAFFMAGCELGEVIDDLPSIALNGESIIEIEQYSEFIDPGVEVLGDFDLDVVVDSEVDTSILGEYTITYTITYLEIEYNVRRTVNVVEVAEVLPSIELVGDSEITIELYTFFSDPGAVVVGDFDLEITITSYLDVITVGEYVITYTIMYQEIEYSVTRTVNVVDSLGLVPSIELIGDVSMQVEQDTVFTDPGAKIIGDFDLEITVTSDVDMSTEGNYTIVYSITYEDIVYSVTRNIEVVFELSLDVPAIELTGEASMQVVQDTVFVDPGAVVIGAFALVIDVQSNVDMTTLGTYTITYTITYLGVDYSVSRSVEVIEEPSTFDITLNYGSITQTSIGVSLTLVDDDGMLGSTQVKIYKDDVLVDNYAFVVGDNEILFSGLEDDTWYKVVLSGSYLLDGMTMVLSGYSLDVKTLKIGNLSVTMDDVTVDESEIEFGVDVVDADGLITSMSANLYLGDDLVETIALSVGINGIVFDELLGTTTYIVKVEYTYTPHGATEEITVYLDTLELTTLELIAPEVVSNVCNERYYHLECVAEIDYTGFEGYYVWAVLYLDGVSIDSKMLLDDYTTYEFNYIATATDYVIEIYADFTYTSSGGIYTAVSLGTYEVSTLTDTENVALTVENVVITRTTTTVTVEFDLIDDDNALDIGFIKLYQGSSSSNSNRIVVGHNSFTLDSYINENTLYTVKILIDDTGNGSFTTIFEEDVYTPPVITINSLEQTEMFFTGDHIILELVLDNDEEVEIDFVIINGTRYSTFVFPTTYEVLYIDLGVENVADTHIYNLESIGILLGEEEYLIEETSSASVIVYLPGTMAPSDATVKVIDIIPEDYYVTIDREHPSAVTSLNISIYLDNKYILPVSSITIGGITYTGSNLTVVSPTELLISADFTYESGNSNNNLYFSEIMFTRNGNITTDNQGEHTTISIYKIYDRDANSNTAEVIHVSTPEELLAVYGNPAHPGIVYVLDNNIDMTGYSFTPIGTSDDPFTGGFDGNGYTISNVTINQTYGEGSGYKYVGLFGYSNGFITNLVIDNLTINITTTEDNHLYVGILAGRSMGDVYEVDVINSSITINGIVKGQIGGLTGESAGDLIRTSADTDITIIGANLETTSYSLMVGGLVGNKSYDDIRSSHASGDVNITNTGRQLVYVGGLAGFMYNNGSSNPNYIMNSYATGNVSTTADYYGRTGGLVGDTYMYNNTTVILNSYASGDVYASAGKIGGLTGESYATIIGSFATGNVSSIYSSSGRLFGEGSNYNIELIYAYDGQVVSTESGPISGSDFYFTNIGLASAIQFNDANYYLNHLEWNTHFYDFSSLDVENDILPTTN